MPSLDPGGHKYDRGLVHALAGKMPGAIALAATAAARAGAGYVRISTSRHLEGLPSSIVQVETAEVNDERIRCLLVGPGLGDIPQVLTLALTSRAPKVVDADAITHLGDPERLRGQDAIITPHEGEFERLFGKLAGTKAERALVAARCSGAVVVYKGADTLVASPDGRLGFRPPTSAWLASAGTGDVLAGVIATMSSARTAGVRCCLRRGLAAGESGADRRSRDDRGRSRRRDSRSHRTVHELIVRIAARGDGVTESGRHVSFGVPGDALLDDGGASARTASSGRAVPALPGMRRMPAPAR